jgi:hypothetical protein
MLTETLPWHTQYVSFVGTLPNITSYSVLFTRVAFQLSASVLGSTVTCLYITSQTEPVIATHSRNVSTGALTNTAATGRIRRNSGSAGCENGNLSGTSISFTEAGNTRAITATLVA